MSMPSIIELQNRFLRILPRIETHARIYFRAEKCPHKKADRVAETVALAWLWLVRLAEKGRDATHFPSALATLAARAVKSGRRLVGMIKAKDAMNENTQQKRGFTVCKLPDFSTLSTNPLVEALCENPNHDPAILAPFRIDFPRWKRSHSRRDRQIIHLMMLGHGTKAIARKHHLSEGRISQMRSELKQSWDHWCEPPAEQPSRVA